MSKTDKTRPTWVKEFDTTIAVTIDHDHTSGQCRVQTLAQARQFATSGRYVSHPAGCCAKYVWIEYTCTKKDPEPANNGMVECWRSSVVYPQDGSPYFRFVRCTGHRRRVLNMDIPCACDTWVRPLRPTCEQTLPEDGTSHYGPSLVRGKRNKKRTRRERAQVRTQTVTAVKRARYDLDVDVEGTARQRGCRRGCC